MNTMKIGYITNLPQFFVLLVLMLGVSWFGGWGLVFHSGFQLHQKVGCKVRGSNFTSKKGGPFLNPISAGQTIPNVKAFF